MCKGFSLPPLTYASLLTVLGGVSEGGPLKIPSALFWLQLAIINFPPIVYFYFFPADIINHQITGKLANTQLYLYGEYLIFRSKHTNGWLVGWATIIPNFTIQKYRSTRTIMCINSQEALKIP